MIFLISPENDIPNEIDILHQLFEAGLTHFHFRKPNKSIEEHREYLDQIDKEYHEFIVIHNFQELAKEYNLKGIHLEERIWRGHGEALENYVNGFKSKEFSVSSSYHEPEDLEAQTVDFDYFILSPVFGAISKSDMKGRGFDVRHIPKFITGMGGINAQTTPDAIKLGFQGVGALGGVWNSDHPIESFIALQNAFENANVK